jgi:hypothetical protein
MEVCSHLRKVNVAGQFACLSVLHSESRLQELRNTKEHSVRTVAVPAGFRIWYVHDPDYPEVLRLQSTLASKINRELAGWTKLTHDGMTQNWLLWRWRWTSWLVSWLSLKWREMTPQFRHHSEKSVGIMTNTVRNAQFAVLYMERYSILMFIYCRYKYIINNPSLSVYISINITAELKTQSKTDITQHSGKTCFYFRSHRSTSSPSPHSFPYCQVLPRI